MFLSCIYLLFLSLLLVLLHYTTVYIRLMAFFQDNLGKPAPEKQNHSGKTNLDLLEQEIVSGSGISWAYANLHLAPDR